MPNERIIYRADTRRPSEIFVSGFTPRFAGGIRIGAGGQAIGGISTSKELSIAMKYAAMYGGYVYAMKASGIDVVSYLLGQNSEKKAIENAMTQMEIHCERIPRTHVLAARKVQDCGSSMRLVGKLEINPIGAMHPEMAIVIELLSANVTVNIPFNSR